MAARSVYAHPQALNESEDVGGGTRIWAFAHVMRGAVIGRRCNIGDHVFVEGGARVGNGVTVKNGVCLWEGVTIEDFAFVGPCAAFTNDRFPRSPRAPVVRRRYATRGWLQKTRVCEGATIGANATVLCGLTVGRYAMVAAGAVVVRDVGAYELVAGCPARRVGFVCACGQPLKGKPPRRCASCARTYAAGRKGLKRRGA